MSAVRRRRNIDTGERRTFRVWWGSKPVLVFYLVWGKLHPWRFPIAALLSVSTLLALASVNVAPVLLLLTARLSRKAAAKASAALVAAIRSGKEGGSVSGNSASEGQPPQPPMPP